MKSELILTPEDQALLDAINNINDYWHEMALPDHPIYPQFSRKLIVKGFSNPDMKKPEERIYVYVSQVLTIKETNVIHKEIQMPYWMIHESNKEEIVKGDGSFMKGTRIFKDEEGNIIEEKEEIIKASSIKYVRFLIKTKSVHLTDVLEKFMVQYIPIFENEINNI